jgi:hypothetical protein
MCSSLFLNKIEFSTVNIHMEELHFPLTLYIYFVIKISIIIFYIKLFRTANLKKEYLSRLSDIRYSILVLEFKKKIKQSSMQHTGRCVTFDRFSCMLQLFCAGTCHLRKMLSSYDIFLVCSENTLLNSLHEGRAYVPNSNNNTVYNFFLSLLTRLFI